MPLVAANDELFVIPNHLYEQVVVYGEVDGGVVKKFDRARS